jgi:putative Holliday junction resolvase
MKILAIDLGKKRIGLAVSDRKTVAGLDTIKFDDLRDAIDKISEISRQEKVEKIIIGIPIGNVTSEDQSRSFAMELAKIIEIPVEFINETLTSKEAERLLKGAKLNYKSEKYKQEIDKISAKLILEQYLANSNKEIII